MPKIFKDQKMYHSLKLKYSKNYISLESIVCMTSLNTKMFFDFSLQFYTPIQR